MPRVETKPQEALLNQPEFRSVVRELLFGVPDYPFDAERGQTILTLDPELSVTTEIVKEVLPKSVFLNRFNSMLEIALLDNLSRDRKISKKRTESNVSALNNYISSCSANESYLFPDDKIDLEFGLLTLIGTVVSSRPDMTEHVKFPWEAAVKIAVFVPPDFRISRHDSRMNILGNAPYAELKQALTEFTAQGGDVLDTLGREQPSPWEKEPYISPIYLRILEMLPDDLEATRSVVNWVAQQEQRVMSIALDNPKFIIPYKALGRIELKAVNTWHNLSPEDRSKFLTTNLIYQLCRLYPEVLDDIVSGYASNTLANLPRLNGLIPSIVKETSQETIHTIAERIKSDLRRNPGLKLGAMSDWFPGMAAELEEYRPRGIVAKISKFVFAPRN